MEMHTGTYEKSKNNPDEISLTSNLCLLDLSRSVERDMILWRCWASVYGFRLTLNCSLNKNNSVLTVKCKHA